MDKEWLNRKTSMEEAEHKYMVENDQLGPKPVSFGFKHQEWISFKRKIQKGDELWEFSSPQYYWHIRTGRAGISIVRKGKIIDSIITLMN